MNEVPTTTEALTVLAHEVNEVKQLLIISQAAAANTKAVLTTEEASHYMGISLSHLYRLTSTAQIPFSKPSGKLMYFNREKLDAWLLNNTTNTNNDIEIAASTYCLNKKRGIV